MDNNFEIDCLPSTSTSLICRVKLGEQDAWERLVRLYSGVVYSKCRKYNISPEDSADTLQNVFLKVYRAIGNFRKDGVETGFRRWLRTLVENVIMDHFRELENQRKVREAATLLEELRDLTARFVIEEPSRSSSSVSIPAGNPTSSALKMSDFKSDQLIQAIIAIRLDFEECTWRAFWRTAVDGQRGVDVAEELNVSSKCVRQAKYMVLKRLRLELSRLS